MDSGLRDSLCKFIKKKFYSYPNVCHMADDIVHEAYLKLKTSRLYTSDKENFGYLSVVALRLAYRAFMSQSRYLDEMTYDAPGMALISEDDVLSELMEAQDCAAVLESLKILKEIERAVITERYYGDFSFAEIAANNNLKLNTVLSHHRRALEKLRPKLTGVLGLREERYYE